VKPAANESAENLSVFRQAQRRISASWWFQASQMQRFFASAAGIWIGRPKNAVTRPTLRMTCLRRTA